MASIRQGTALIEPAGSQISGQQVQGIVRQYQASGINQEGNSLDTITPYDSGTILGNCPPGKPAEKLVSGTVQRAAQIVCSGNMADGVTGNCAGSTLDLSTNGEPPTPPTGSTAGDGLSMAPQHE
jgi:hypothetical protein